MQIQKAFSAAAAFSLLTSCSRTPQPQSTPSASPHSSAAPAAVVTAQKATPSATIRVAAPDPDAIRSQEDCPERMIFIPGGKLQFTGPVPGDKDETPKKQSFDVGSFCIDQFEARNLDWDSERSGGTVESKCGKRETRCTLDAKVNGPATCVTPTQAECYCAHILPNIPKRLPTDQEFLFAALGTDGRLFPWGNELYPDGKWGAAPDFCSFEPNEEPKAHICAPWQNKRDRSPFGVIGMATNGSEVATFTNDIEIGYLERGVNHHSIGLKTEDLALVRTFYIVKRDAKPSPFGGFRCVTSERYGS